MTKEKKKWKLHRFVAAGLLLAGFFCYENETIMPTEYHLADALLPQEFSGFRVVQISDLHGRNFGEDNERLLSLVREQKPDIIALTGDLSDVTADYTAIPSLLENLRKIAPVYYVTGNHEWAIEKQKREELFAMIEDCGVQWLRNEYVLLERSGAKIVLAGVDDPNGPMTQKTPKQLVDEIHKDVAEDAYILMLAHRNDQLTQWAALGVQTVLCGHAHGGMIRLPGVGGVLGTKHDLFPEYDAGVYEQGTTKMLVSRGLGLNRFVPTRVFNRPEIPTVILEREIS